MDITAGEIEANHTENNGYPLLINEGNDRSREEILIFCSVTSLLILLRLPTLIIFTVFTIRYIRLTLKQTGSIDWYTTTTLALLGVSFIFFLIYRGLDITIAIIYNLESPDG
jgi:hypothetical protein